jgi:hypothetical protein
MRADSVAWERAAEVRAAAAGWRRGGFIDEATERAVQEAFPDPCVTPSLIWRVLTAAAVAAVVLCTLIACVVAFGESARVGQLLLLLFAIACLVATDRLEASPRLARRGAAGAASVLGVGFLLGAFALFLSETLRLRLDDGIDTLLIAGVVVCGAACWRWGNPLFAALAGLSLFLFLARLPHGRPFWLLIGAALAGLAARRLDAQAWAPSHRLGAAVLVVAGIGAVYAAVNVYSFDERLLESLARFAPDRVPPSRPLLVLSAIATAAMPVAVLGWGARSRRAFLLDTGIVLAALSLVTLRHYVHLAPLWTVLTLAGAALVLGALAVERTLRRAPRRERAGFTAEPLFSDERRQQTLQIVPVVAAFAPAAATSERPGFAGEGGRFGGSGATEKF